MTAAAATVPRRNARRIATTAPWITATCGNEGKFSKTGPLAFPAVIARVLQTTGGQHVHIGPVSPGFIRAARAALTRAGIEHDRLEFTGEVASVATVLVEKNVGLFLGSFPVGGALSLIEAAAAGVPIAVRDPGTGVTEELRYTSGIDFRPPEALIWSDMAALEQLLTGWVPAARLNEMIKAGRDWARKSHAPERFRRRPAGSRHGQGRDHR